MEIHYIMPMAGRGSRFKKYGYDFPKPMLEIYGKPFFYWSTQSIRKYVDLASLDFVVLQEHIDKFSIDKKIKTFFPNAEIHVLAEVTDGAVVTSMKGIVDINDDLPIVFNDCDHLFKCTEFNEFCHRDRDNSVDGLLLTFESDESKYSFIGKDENGNVNRTVEKEAISTEAICGCYYFRNKTIFWEAAEKYLEECSYSEYYMSGVYNIMLKNGQVVKSMMTDYHVPFGIPEEYEAAKNNCSYRELI